MEYLDPMKMNQQQKVWDSLAKIWKGYRTSPWKDVQRFLNYLSEQSAGRILEIGCGNGRNLLQFAKVGFDCYGIDFSKEMLRYAEEFSRKNKVNLKLKQARAENLPFKDNYFDYVLSIAVLHHLNKEEQGKAVREMFRVLKKEGKAVVSVWNKFNPKFWRFLLKKETLVPWKVDKDIFSRYYYFFSYFELKKLLKKSGFKIIKASSAFGRNIVFEIIKG